MTKTPHMPLHGPSPPEVPLPKAPLVRVIAQVRFPMLLTARDPNRVAIFQEAIRDRYPHLDQQNTIMVVSGGVPATANESRAVVHWRFADEAANFKWRVTLAHDFIALETRAYESRQDFMERLETILQTLGETLAPTHMMRFGMRYIDQIKGEPMARIDTLLQGSAGRSAMRRAGREAGSNRIFRAGRTGGIAGPVGPAAGDHDGRSKPSAAYNGRFVADRS